MTNKTFVMTYGTDPANPTEVQYSQAGELGGQHQSNHSTYQQYGLTKREYFAAMFTAAQITGIVTASGDNYHGWTREEFAKVGVSIADALIDALNKQP